MTAPPPRLAALPAWSLALHAAALPWLLWQPRAWPWVLALLVLDHGLLAGAGLWPRCRLLGPNLTRLPAAAAARGEVALTLDDGPDPAVTPAVLDLLDAGGAKATFFCIGRQAQRHPDLCREMLRRGHALENHSQHHRHDFSLLGPRRIAREIDAAQRVLSQLGARPRFFRAPAGLRNVFLQGVLRRRGLLLSSWTRRGFDTRETDPQRVLRRLLQGLRAGDVLLLHDANSARTAAGRPVVLEVLPPLLQALQAAGLRPVTLAQALDPDARDDQRG